MACTCTCTCSGDHDVWAVWVTSNSAVTGSTAGVVWAKWCSDTSITTPCSTDGAWTYWVFTDSGPVTIIAPAKPRELTAEEREAQRIAREEADRKAKVANEQREAARKRARELLVAHLTAEQKRTLEKNKWFVVEGGKSKKKYRIEDKGSVHGNIWEVSDDGKEEWSLCAQCSDYQIPVGDNLLAQAIMLRFAEDEFLRIANRSQAYRRAA